MTQNVNTTEKKYSLDKKTRQSVMWRSTWLQGSWNYERMQNGGWCFAMVPVIRKLYPKKKTRLKQ